MTITGNSTVILNCKGKAGGYDFYACNYSLPTLPW
jgi:hypothetical protein